MKLQYFEIEFDNPSSVFYAGKNVSGSVVIVLSEPMEMRGVRLRFRGRAKVEWTKKNGKNTDHYRSEECYVDEEVTVYGRDRGADGRNLHMPAGTNSFKFSYAIPPTCPSSFEAKHGNILYFVEAEIDRPWRFNHKTKRPFTLLSMVDLNNDPRAGQPSTLYDQKLLGAMCCPAGQVTYQVTLPKTGYVPGEVVTVNAEIRNDSSRYVGPVTMRLIQNTTFTGYCFWSTDYKSKQVVLAQAMKEETVERGESQIWNNEGLCLPPIPPTMSGCSIIVLHYIIEFKIELSGLSNNITLAFPITVGTVPLRQQIPQFQQAYRQYSVDAGVAMPAGPPTAPFMDTYPELPPPAYAEAAGGRVSIMDDTDDEYTRGQMDYAPRYAYYDWAKTTADQRTTVGPIKEQQ